VVIQGIPLLLASKWVGLCRRWQVREAKRFTSRETPQLLAAYRQFAQANQSGAPRQPFKGRDLWRILDSVRPASIVELGSGTTSAVFALWAREHAARYTAYEHHQAWSEVTSRCLDEAGLAPAAGSAGIVCIPTRVAADQSSIGFAQALPEDADFLYVDGPPCVLDSGRKVPNDDATRLLDGGHRPRAIVIDGRTETVDLLLKHPAISKYDFRPGLAYCLRKGLFLQALAGREHTLFLLK